MTEPEQRRYRNFGARPDGSLLISHGQLDAAALPSRIQAWFPPVIGAAKEPFVGITTDGHVVPDLFALRDTGWNPEPAASAAVSFLDSLTPVQRKAVLFAIDAPEWRMWINAALGELIDQYRDTLTEYRFSSRCSAPPPQQSCGTGSCGGISWTCIP